LSVEEKTQAEELESLRRQLKHANREIKRLQRDNKFLGVINDQADKRLEYSEHNRAQQVFYNETIIQNSPNISILLNKDLKTVLVTSTFFTKSRAYTEDDLADGVDIADLFKGIMNEVSRTRMRERCLASLQTGKHNQYFERLEVKEGNEFFDVHIRPTVKDGGEIVGVIVILIEITDIVEAKERAERADRAKSSFLANMSHEIRTPMNAINGMAQFIIRDTTDSFARENAIMIKNASASLLAIINDILDFSKIEAGRMDIIPVPYHLSSLINDVATMINIRLQDKPVELILDINEAIPALLVGDEIRLKQIMVNLLNNAVKFTEQGSITFKMWHEQTYTDEIRLYGSVTDTGIGIRPDDLLKLFSSFEQVDTKKNRTVEGTGLGLAISKQLCRAMGGDIEVSSTYGKGTTFTWSVLNKVEKWQPIGKLSKEECTRQTKLFEYTFTAPEARVLIVDDNKVNLKVAAGLLQPYKLQITMVDSGKEALHLLAKENYDIVFMDHMMPGMDGVETMLKIRELPKRAHTCVIALTANAISGVKEQYISIGFQSFLAEPIEPEPLDKCLKQFLPVERIVMLEHPSTLQNGADTDHEVLLQVYLDGRKKLHLLAQLVEAEDFTNYTIEVHALKNVAATIGRMELSDLAKEHEQAGKSGDFAFIRRGLDVLLARYSAVIAELGNRFADELYADKPRQSKHQVTAAELQDIIDAMQGAITDYDLDALGVLLDRLDSIELDEKQSELLERTRQAQSEYDYDALDDLSALWQS